MSYYERTEKVLQDFQAGLINDADRAYRLVSIIMEMDAELERADGEPEKTTVEYMQSLIQS